MEFHCLALFFSLIVMLMAAQAALSPEVYWERMLPNTPIPKVIREFSKLDGVKETSSQEGFPYFYSYGIKKKELQDGVKEISSREKFPYFYSYGMKKKELQDGAKEISSREKFPYFYSYGIKKKELQNDVKEISSREKFPYFYSYGIKKKELKDSVKEISSREKFPYFYSYGIKKKELQDGVTEISSQQDGFVSINGVEKNFLQDDSKEIPLQDETPYDSQSKENDVLRGIGPVANHSKPSLFFSEEGLRRGAKLDVQFPKTNFVTPLLPREITEHLPFSSEKINEILEILGVKPESKNAENVEETLKICEEPAMNGEEKHCATSVESMVDFVTSKLGKNVHVTSTEAEKVSKSQKFIVKDGVKILAEEEIIACHPMNYPYVVFYCHKISNSTAHFMPLEGGEGTRVKAVAVCHKDTSEWDPNNIAFQVLKVKPGTVPVCHLFPDGHLIWYTK